ncbi:Uncharacterised protein [Alloiococcus otitis]|uniref:Uncharacterized protein n=1 Tax=Alloiococcus otitis ATCC 51267 TaxID=883081 RepID=K9E9V7_9LACT|nr:hypothetical protein [Alloiococcus otitis]EKU93468.1 hypothetical protein HMPREF9698_01000 [Alloiococcus otitis ATCC 51267]SUU81469.1 Uncharacterised protein [Alloiococcus otitis]
MIEKENLEKIERLFNLDSWYIVSPFLNIYPYESDFDHLQEYFEREYLHECCDSIKNII